MSRLVSPLTLALIPLLSVLLLLSLLLLHPATCLAATPAQKDDTDQVVDEVTEQVIEQAAEEAVDEVSDVGDETGCTLGSSPFSPAWPLLVGACLLVLIRIRRNDFL